MDSKFLKLGTVVIYSIIIPGILIAGFASFLIEDFKLEKVMDLTIISLIFGFITNVFGHFTGLIYRSLNKKYQGIPFTIYLKSYKLDKEISSLLRKDSEFWFSIYTFYWNTAMGLILLFIYKILTDQTFKYIELSLIILLISILIYLSINLLNSLYNLKRDIQPLININYKFSQSYFDFLKPKHISSLASILSSINVNSNIWHTKTKDEFKDLIRKWLENPLNICVIMEENNDLVGFGRLDFYKHEKRSHVAIIGPVAINPSYQNKGYGKLLINELEKIAISRNILRIEASFPHDSEHIKSIFKHNGFEYECTHIKCFKSEEKGIIDMEQWSKFTSNNLKE